jgi:hypothetical protein
MRNNPAALLLALSLAIVAAAGITHCSGCNPGPVVPPAPDASDAGWYGDAYRSDAPADICEAAEARIATLTCRFPDGSPVVTAPGVFASACRRATRDHRDWRTDCLARLAACDRLEASYRAVGACP